MSTAKTPTARLDRLLANMGYGSRKTIQAMVKAGRVVFDNKAVSDASMHVPVSRDLSARLVVAGSALDPAPGLILMLHKPLGVTCSHKEAGPLVYDLLPERWRLRKPAISSIGRLDKDTSGLLLMTDDGGLLHRIIAPRSNVTKRYCVVLARPLRGDEAAALASGKLMLEGETKPLLPVGFEVLAAATGGPARTPEHPHVRVTLHEGRYHQVRRMFAALGNHVEELHRDQIGGLTLPDDLTAGEFRVLDEAGTNSIFV